MLGFREEILTDIAPDNWQQMADASTSERSYTFVMDIWLGLTVAGLIGVFVLLGCGISDVGFAAKMET
jgi:hypothetical protein